MIRFVLFLAHLLASIIHGRTSFLADQIMESFSGFEFTFKETLPKIRGMFSWCRSAFKQSLFFWLITAVAVMVIGLISIRDPRAQNYDNTVEGYFLQKVDTGQNTLFGAAAEYMIFTADWQTQMYVGLDANTPLEDEQGQFLSWDDVLLYQPLRISWNGQLDAPEAVVIEVLSGGDEGFLLVE